MSKIAISALQAGRRALQSALTRTAAAVETLQKQITATDVAITKISAAAPLTKPARTPRGTKVDAAPVTKAQSRRAAKAAAAAAAAGVVNAVASKKSKRAKVEDAPAQDKKSKKLDAAKPAKLGAAKKKSLQRQPVAAS
jgi:hypothetical protein